MNLADALDLFLTARIVDGLSPFTIQWYRSWLGQFVRAFGHLSLSEVTRQHIREYVIAQRSRCEKYLDHPCRPAHSGNLSPYSVNGQIRALRAFFAWLAAEGHIQASGNPMLGVRLVKLPCRQPRSVSLPNLRRLIRITTGDTPAQRRDHAMILFLADTGCRAAGLLNLTLSDLDLDRRLAVVIEKGGRSRQAPFTEVTRAALVTWLETRPLAQDEHVFLSFRTVKKLTYSGLHQMLTRLKERAGITGRVNPHSFRHGFARQYLLNGGDLGTLSDLMGHASVKVTKDFYAVYTIGELARQHEKFSPITHLYHAEAR